MRSPLRSKTFMMICAGVVVGALAVPLGPAVADGIQQVVVVNDDAAPVPVKPVTALANRSAGRLPSLEYSDNNVLFPLETKTYESSAFAMQASMITVWARDEPVSYTFLGPHPLTVVVRDGQLALPLAPAVVTGRKVAVKCLSKLNACHIHFWITGTAGLS